MVVVQNPHTSLHMVFLGPRGGKNVFCRQEKENNQTYCFRVILGVVMGIGIAEALFLDVYHVPGGKKGTHS